jgi:hypothetical protein
MRADVSAFLLAMFMYSCSGMSVRLALQGFRQLSFRTAGHEGKSLLSTAASAPEKHRLFR